MLNCFRTRRRIGAYLDGALEGAAASAAERHLAGCAACQRQAEGLRRMKALLQRSLGRAVVPAEPDWTGFWPGVVRGIDAARLVPAPRRRPVWRQPRWALGGALAAAALASVTIWEWQALVPTSLENAVVVSSADTDHPGGSVMIYHAPEKDMTVVWVFGLDD